MGSFNLLQNPMGCYSLDAYLNVVNLKHIKQEDKENIINLCCLIESIKVNKNLVNNNNPTIL